MNDAQTPESKFHRIRHYPKVWSTFDMIEPCKAPKPCWVCQYNHPFCTEGGAVPAPESSP